LLWNIGSSDLQPIRYYLSFSLFFIFRVGFFELSRFYFLSMKFDKSILGKNYTLASWFFNKSIIVIISKIMGVGVKKTCVVYGFDIVIEVVNKNIYPTLLFLSKHTL
jgi:hypothetical protein